MKRLVAASTQFALVLTLLATKAGFGQQDGQAHQGQPSNHTQPTQGQGQPGQPSAGQPLNTGQPAHAQGQPGQQSTLFIQLQEGQNGKPPGQNQAQQAQGNNPNRGSQAGKQSGKPGQGDDQSSKGYFYHQNGSNAQQGDHLFWSYPNWSETGTGQGRVFALWVDEASRNSGMSLAPADPALRRQLKLPENQGLIVTQIEPNSPAVAAGIRQNDVLIRLGETPGQSNAMPLGKPEDLENALKDQGEQVIGLVLLRSGRPVTLKVQPRVHASLGPARPEPPTFWIGITVVPVEPALRSQLMLAENQGLIVVDVDKQGPAARAGVLKFDIIRLFDGVTPTDQTALTKLVQSRGGKEVKVQLLREAKPMELKLAPERRQRLSARVSMGNPILSARFVEQVLPITVTRAPEVQTLDVVNLNLISDLVTERVHVADGKAGVPADLAMAKRLDDLTAQIKELREAVEAMTRAQAEKNR